MIENIRCVEGNRYLAEVDGVEHSVNIRTGELDPETAVRLALQEALSPLEPTYAEKRLMEYPALTDQLDALWKGGADMDEMRARINAVKAKYPKA